ncbi:peptidyl-prolyl cis-trans isomerase chloroplastic [Chlorella sorokiniana]|uniref:peptidylprolyl isomerase n=1 Tax=Chlorella sorokiniana TaxID=3076 RepID=A0A2P6TKL1_CHLSO|nr:peptidyl-prolyl cis-trans isomerase chloroplastic [Chlorella sorokiniana]|eukprot:PRW44615.1 peptidyl-prolyl cis-trans isomerase chloroplastic [Chlorella sorokiniana]
MAAASASCAFQTACSAQRSSQQRRRGVVVAAAAAPPPPAGGAAAASQLSRRQLQAAALAAVLAAVQAPAAQAVGFKKELKKRKIPEEDYSELPGEPRLRYYELAEGSGAEVKDGSRVVVHFQCKYRGLTVVSSLSARVLGGNRTVAEPFEFTAGQPVSGPAARSVESAGGLYAGGGVKPPPALSPAVIGMRAGGKRSVLVPADLGYGSKGEQEIPPDCEQFELQIELLSVA